MRNYDDDPDRQDHVADAADARHRMIAELEVEARQWTGVVRCETCRETIDQAADRHCVCPVPAVRTISQVVADAHARILDLAGQVEAAADREQALMGRVAEAQAVASEAETMARLARQHADDLVGVLERQRAAVAGFVAAASGILHAARQP